MPQPIDASFLFSVNVAPYDDLASCTCDHDCRVIKYENGKPQPAPNPILVACTEYIAGTVMSAVLQKRTYDVNVDWRFRLDCARVRGALLLGFAVSAVRGQLPLS